MIELLHAAARGTFPPEDGRTDVVGPADGAPAAVLSFTAHHVVAADVLAGEVEPGRRDRGLARLLVGGALAAAAPEEPVFAQVAAANAASLRALQPAGFAAVGAEVLFGPAEDFLRRWTNGQVAVS